MKTSREVHDFVLNGGWFTVRPESSEHITYNLLRIRGGKYRVYAWWYGYLGLATVSTTITRDECYREMFLNTPRDALDSPATTTFQWLLGRVVNQPYSTMPEGLVVEDVK